LNLYYASWIEVTLDLFLLSACTLSLMLTYRQKPRRHFVWWPLYFGFLFTTLPMIWASGGIYSPWLGLYLAVLTILGSTIQTRIAPLYGLLFMIFNVTLWTIASRFLPAPDAVAYVMKFPPIFMALSIAICLIGVAYCMHGLIRTERDLAIEIERQYTALFEARATLLREENANQTKSAFLANISHELRTPLGAILGYAHLLQHEDSHGEKLDFARSIERNGEQLARLVDDLLDLSKIEAGRIELEKIECKLSDVIHETLNVLTIHARKKNVEVNVRFATPVPDAFRTDPFRLKQILTNIIGNAVKFTDHGAIDILLSFASLPRSELTIRVRDTGRGIAPDERSKLFKPFSQADPSMTRKYGGTGLGLNFSRALARLLGGDLELTWSQLNEGSEFTLRVPVETASDAWMTTRLDEPQPPPAPKETTAGGFDFKGRRFLIVDDSPDNRDILQRFLMPTGALLDEATDGVECLEKVARIPYDMIFMDIQMPRMDGLQATKILRERHFQGAIVALTAHAMKQDRERCLAAGCNEHLSKPIQRLALMETVARYVRPAEDARAHL
jgi:signal transduction histidine kinase/CheY-like chemotaxis protein